ncbi:MAG: hypothetical protein ACK5LH_04585 [Akkermansiaceae bacterium]|jgi:hypothetical protein
MNINKLEEKAKQLRASASKFKKQQIATTTAIMIGFTAISVITTFSQGSEKPDAVKATPMALPARMWVEDKDGRQISASVVARDETGITILKTDPATGLPGGKELQIAWDKLHPDVRIQLDGEKTWEEIRQERMAKFQADAQAKQFERDAPKRAAAELQALQKELSERRKELSDKFRPLSAKLQQEALIKNERDIQVFLSKDSPDIYPYPKVTYIDFKTIAKQMELQETKDEVVSLRPEFEKLRVTATQQVGNTCSAYSAYHLVQFLTKKHGLKTPTVDQLQTAANAMPAGPNKGAVLPTFTVNAIAKLTGKNVKVTQTKSLLINLSHEVTKELLRKGIPSILAWYPTKKDGYDSENGGGHASVVIGFVVKNGITQWEIIDSNQIWKDKGYKFIAAKNTTMGEYAIELE